MLHNVQIFDFSLLVIRHTHVGRSCPDRPQKATQKVGISPIDPLFQRGNFDGIRKIDPLFAFFRVKNALIRVSRRSYSRSERVKSPFFLR